MKKKLTYLIALSVVLMSCSKNEVTKQNISENEANEISFNTVIGKQTKGAELQKSVLEADANGFKCYGYVTADEFSNATVAADLHFNLSIKNDAGSWVNSAPDKIYWPLSGKLSAFSYYPTTDVTYAAPGLSTNPTAPTLTYTVSTTVADQKDIVAASTMNKDKASNLNKLSINLKHILSQVRFKAATGDDTYCAYVKKIEVKGVKKTGTYSFNTTTDGLGTWAPAAETADYVYYDSEATGGTVGGIKCTNSMTAIETTTLDNYLMLIPQSSAADFKLVVTYDIKSTDGLITHETNVVRSADMMELLVGKKYSYNLILPMSPTMVEIKFDVIWDVWDTEITVNVAYQNVIFGNDSGLSTGLAGALKTFETIFKNGETDKFSAIVTPAASVSLSGAISIDLTSMATIATKMEANDYIILDFSGMDAAAFNSKTITFTSLPIGLSMPVATISAPGIIKITKTI